MSNAEKIKMLKIKQTSLKAKFTRFVTFLNDIEEHKDYQQLEMRFQNLENALDTLTELQHQIIVLSPQEEGCILTDLENFEEKYYKEMSRAQTLLKQSKFTTNKIQNQTQGKQVTDNSFNQIETRVKNKVTTTIDSRNINCSEKLEFLITPRICDVLPLQYVKRQRINIPHNVKLADPEFHKPNQIDALIRAELYADLFCIGQIEINKFKAKLQKTKLGWIITGKIDDSNNKEHTMCNMSLVSIKNQIERFWKIEELPEKKFMSKEDAYVEKFYQDTVKRDSTGRYIVQLPFNSNKSKLGESFKLAERRFYALERKLENNTALKQQYSKCIHDFIDLRHMVEVPSYLKNKVKNYLSHHAVMKDSSLTTKLRIVFDGSAKTSSGLSLNDVLYSGPNIQEELYSILIRFRSYPIVITADIEKHYRMILMDNEDCLYQVILWRDNSNQPLKEYMIKVVMFGSKPSTYLSVRTLHQLAKDESKSFPIASKIIKRDFYIDDLITGAQSLIEAIQVKNEIQELLHKGGFNLRKWASNDENLIKKTLPEDIKIFANSEHTIKTLGIEWDSKSDLILYSAPNSSNLKITKRNILSQISQLFDPIGLLGPVIVKAKIIMQELWKVKNLNWDESVPIHIYTAWINYQNNLKDVNTIKFERNIIINDPINIQVHGFCDASEKAYGACIYLRSTSQNNQIKTYLLCSKFRIAPLKFETLAKLELCAALLLAKLLQKTLNSLEKLKINNVYLWSDAEITLQWINTETYLLKTFYANRVSQILSITSTNNWRYVPGEHNPADYISRGQTPSELKNNKVWYYGPSWINNDESTWPKTNLTKNIPVPQLKFSIILKTCCKQNLILTRYSSLAKLKRVVVYCLRFINNTLKINSRLSGILSSSELNSAMTRIVLLTQYECFSEDIKSLKTKLELSRSSDLRSLNPFLDASGLIRVGGRLKNSLLTFNEKYPIVLPKNHHVTELIIRETHVKFHHSGTLATLNAVRSSYWPINGKVLIKRILRQCIRCFRTKPISKQEYIMGNLPTHRVIQSRPFINVGVDYCGPFFVKEKKFRNRSKVKVYTCLFVCFATKACHIELVSDMTSESFLAALKRFFARRGKSENIYSDNGSNFVGANNDLIELKEFLQSNNHNKIVSEYLSNLDINWHFSPAQSPHFGGLWEAAVKSYKYHFYRIIANTLFTYEELNTFAAEIEAILNSRPITPLSSDPNDFKALTPAHLLIGDSLMSTPDPDLKDIPVNRLSAWQHIQAIKQHFWKRWHQEYLNELNVRSRWQGNNSEDVPIGTLVVLKEDNIPPLNWVMGRIVKVHPGSDGKIRVVTVRTLKGTYTRCVKRIAPLPIY